MNKKRLLVFGFIAFVILAIIVSTCSGCNSGGVTTTAANTPFEQLQARVGTVESDVAALKVAVANVSVPVSLTSQVSALATDVGVLKSQVATLQAGGAECLEQSDLDGINADLSSLDGRVTITEADIVALNTNLEAVSTDLASVKSQLDGLDITDYSSDIDTLTAGVVALNGKVDALTTQLADEQADIDGLTARLDDIDADLDSISDWWVEWNETPRVDITGWKYTGGGTHFIQMIPGVVGDYTIRLTLYGSGLTTTIADPTNAFVDECFIFNTDQMLVIMLSPNTTSGNWKTTDTIKLILTSGWVVEYAEVGVVAN